MPTRPLFIPTGMPSLVICARLKKAQKDVKNISALVLRHVALDAAVTAAILNLIESREDWESISFDACRGANLLTILSTMLTTRVVKKLVLIQPSHSALALLGKKLHETTHLETLMIQGEMNITDAEVLAEGLAANQTLTCLDYSKCVFEDKSSFATLMTGIRRYQRLRTLHLEACFLEDEQIEKVFRHGLPKFIQEINLGVNFLQSRGTRALATLLQSNTHSLQKLDISRQDVWDDRSYFYLLTDALKVNTTLVSLDVSSNFLDDSHLRLLAKALTKNSTLQELNIGGNSFHSSEGILSFSEQMPSMNGLQCLRMTNMRLTNNQLESLVQGLKGNLTLQKLVLDNTEHALLTLYLTLNRGGRILKRSNNSFPRSMWSLVLARTRTLVSEYDNPISAADIIYDLLHGPVLFER
jgi:Ran GTPase-activating protein (RanGAP) involved in mRNA processing and transport